LLFGHSRTKSPKRDFTPSLKMYKLGPAKINRDLISNCREEEPSTSPKNVRSGFYEGQTPVSPMRPHGGQQLAEMQNARHKVAETTPHREMKPSAARVLATVSKTASDSSDGDQVMLSPPADVSRRQVTSEKQIVYETVGISTQSRLAKSSSETVLMVTPKLIKTRQTSRSDCGQFPSQRKLKLPSQQKDKSFSGGNQGCFDDTETAFQDEISPMADIETPNSALAFVETSSVSSRSCRDVQPHIATGSGRKQEPDISNARCHSDYEARVGDEHQKSVEGTPVALRDTPIEGSGENGPGISLLRESTRKKTRPLVAEQCLKTKSAVGTERLCCDEVRRKYHDDLVSPRVFPKTPRKKDAANCSRNHDVATDFSLEVLDPQMSLPIEADWESPEFSGIQSCGGSDEDSPLADLKSVASGVLESPKAHHIADLRQAFRGRFSGDPKPLDRCAVIPVDNITVKRKEPESPQQESEGVEDEEDSVDFGFVDQGSSDEEESLHPFDPTTPEKKKCNARQGRGYIRNMKDQEIIARNESSRKQAHADSISASTQIHRKGEVDTEDSSMCSTTTAGADQQSVPNARGGIMGWRVRNPPHQICSLQSLDLLPRRRIKKKRITRRRAANVPRKQKMQRRKTTKRRSKN
jgi:hypothetical protein